MNDKLNKIKWHMHKKETISSVFEQDIIKVKVLKTANLFLQLI